MINHKGGNMKKLKEITCCDQCEDFDDQLWRCRREDRKNDNDDLVIPDWCPIPDVPEKT